MSSVGAPPYAALPEAWLAPGFRAFTLPVAIDQPRGIVSLGSSDLLALERGTSSVVLLSEIRGDAAAPVSYNKSTVVTATGLDHGLAIHNGFLYASSSNFVYRWPYGNSQLLGSSGNQQATDTDGAQIVIENIDLEGPPGEGMLVGSGHTTRTIVFDSQGRMYVSVGSASNIDANSYRSRIRRFDLASSSFPIDFSQSEIFADGLRNEVGLAFDKFGILWGVENSADKLQRNDLGADIFNDNPAEDLHRFLEQDAGKHWSYPYCWSEFDLGDSGLGAGTQWAWPSFLSSGVIDDETCRTNYSAPELSMQAHSAPLGITFYAWKEPSQLPSECSGGAFPQAMDGYAFIAFHGSWNRDIPTGYKVVFVAMDENGRAVGTPQNLLMHAPPDAKWDNGYRPVDVEFDACGRLLVSSDGSRGIVPRPGSNIVRIDYLLAAEIDSTTSSTSTTAQPDLAPTGSPSNSTATGSLVTDSQSSTSTASLSDLAPTGSPSHSTGTDGLVTDSQSDSPPSSGAFGRHVPMFLLLLSATVVLRLC